MTASTAHVHLEPDGMSIVTVNSFMINVSTFGYTASLITCDLLTNAANKMIHLWRKALLLKYIGLPIPLFKNLSLTLVRLLVKWSL